MSLRILLLIVVGLPCFAWAQGSVNGGFEDLAPNGIPNGWSIADPSGASTTKDAHLGKVAAKAWIAKTYQPGVWNSKIDVSEGNASQVSGYYKYLGEHSECDKATVSYLLGARSEDGAIDTIAFGDTELKLSKDYRKFDLSVSSVGNGSPDFVNIQFQPAGHCNIHGETNCCFLFVDDIVLAGSNSVNSEPVSEEVETKGKKGKKGEMEVEDGGGAPDSLANLENKGHGEIIPEKEADKIETPAEESVKEEAPAKEAEVVKEETPSEEATEEAIPVEEGAEPVDEEWDTEEESSDGGH
jgi:hypothetical protein